MVELVADMELGAHDPALDQSTEKPEKCLRPFFLLKSLTFEA